MGTNVKPEELNYNYYETKKFVDDSIRSIPGHEELHRHIDQIVEKDYVPRRKIKVLELGVGTGLTAERILRKVPDADYIAVDFSEQMLARAKKHLSPYNIRFINGDYSQIDLPVDNDLVVSVLGIHHQETYADKKYLFQRIYGSLNEVGAFLFGDLVTYRNPTEAALNEAKHFHHLVQNSENEESLREWAYHHKYLNKMAPLEDQGEWLREVGFREVNILFQKFNTALLYAKK